MCSASPRSQPGEVRPPLQRYPAHDGEALAWRFYDSPSDRILIFIHGSSYHGGGYHALAAAISGSGAAKVVLPNLRGHYQSGRRRGDVAYIGQLEDDLADLIGFLRTQGLTGPITLGGHSSGGGLAIRFAAGRHAALVSRILLLSPVIPTSPAMRGGDAGGWAVLNMRRLYGLFLLNMLGLHALDGLPVIAFNKPPELWDGTETLSYSFRLNASYHPHFRYAAEVAALQDRALVLVGADDEAIDPAALQALMTANAPRSQVTIVPGLNHFALFSDPAALQTIEAWLRAS
jgi:pimeloyl-ACP methyl ester carboxylesterase